MPKILSTKKARFVPCTICIGAGTDPSAPTRQCPDCKGKKVMSRRDAILSMAKLEHESEGTLEIDDNAKLSEGDDNGTYIQAWVWVSFAGQPGLDKEPD